MSDTRVEVINYGEFDAREWLRRDVLWASLMTPYSKQMEGWVDGTQKAQHDGNVSRQDLYARSEDAEAQSMAFFNQGKNVAGLVSSVALFKACIAGSRAGDSVNPLEIQAHAIDSVLQEEALVVPIAEVDAYAICSDLADKVTLAPGFGKRQRLLNASRIMKKLAVHEANSWIEVSRQDETNSLPSLAIHDGGHPRSAGSRVEMLQPIFQQIIHSDSYQLLTIS